MFPGPESPTPGDDTPDTPSESLIIDRTLPPNVEALYNALHTSEVPKPTNDVKETPKPGENQPNKPKQRKKLSRQEIKKLKRRGIDPEVEKGGKRTGRWDLYKDQNGNIYIMPKGAQGSGEPLEININQL